MKNSAYRCVKMGRFGAVYTAPKRRGMDRTGAGREADRVGD